MPARAVVIGTRCAEGHWILEVRDDGRGFDPDAHAAPGRRTFGLQFMRERAELVRAEFTVRSQPANGTLIVLDVPIVERGGSA
jgi:signal transduction histidine kinase